MSRPEATVEPGGNEMVRALHPRVCARPRNRGTVLLFMCALALGLGASIGWSQPVPDTILLPDSLGPLRLGYHLAFGSSTNSIYVASESADIMVVDGNTFQRIKRISTGTPVGGALLVSQHNRLYCSYPQQGRIGVIDCATNSIIRTIDVGTRPTLLCYSSGYDKLYCGDTIDRTVTVIDCAADTVREVISVGRSLTAVEYDPTTNKVYAATRDAVQAISCSADSIVANIDAVKASRRLYVNERRQKLYAVGPPVPVPPDTLYVIATGTDSVVANIHICYYADPLQLVCNEVTDRLYCMDYYGDFTEYDCVGDTWLRYRALGGRPQFGVPCDTVRNRLYYLVNIAGRELVRTLDCSTLNVISQTFVGPDPAVLGLDMERRRVMCGGSGLWGSNGVLDVLDCKSDSLSMIATVPLCGWQWGGDLGTVRRNPAARKLYYRWGDAAGGVGVVDEQTNRVVRNLLLPQGSGMAELAYSRTSSKLYCGSAPGVVVLDGITDSILKLVPLVGGAAIRLTWCPDHNKLYCTGMGGPRWYMAVLDCRTDSVIKEIDFYDFPGRSIYMGNGRLLYIYDHHLSLIDCRNDSVMVDTLIPGTIDAVAHSAAEGKIYIVHAGRLEVLDGASLSWHKTIDWAWASDRGADPFLMCSDSTDKLYWFVRDGWLAEPDSVLAIDTRGDTAVAHLGAGLWQKPGCFDLTGRYIFNPTSEDVAGPGTGDNSLIIYDTRLDSVAAVCESLPTWPLSAVPNQEQHRIYVMCRDVVLSYPDVPPGVEEAPNAKMRATRPGPTVARGILNLQPAINNLQSEIALLSVDGRKVLYLNPGANDVRALAPGVYFVRGEGRGAGDVGPIRKVVVTR
jgi:hypothetical protein